ncbi:MAG: PAS domain-containing protein [Gemmatimonadales bacterium]|nr:PAS domain-containing protein [Gemmatimonadales bacterium]NIN09828.1 PAS domain-containing protein [Gemmatimonadales bacterium]NIN48531.1 PAS domain-containing protein [Gemmatimonadales bacterium]NIP05995.1 PAS domain-containing protein [Gemmatimonadales bacterium]NIR01145.1 PAS domain-containing protein [Gemmatimonadales bacterium]
MSPKLSHDTRILLMIVVGAVPAVVAAMLLLWLGDLTAKVQWTITVVVIGWWAAFAFAVRERIIRPLQTLSNLLAALHEGDFSIRARGASTNEALGLALLELNQLGTMLREQRLGAVEATALLRTVIREIDVAVFAFDGEHRLRLSNRAGEQLLGAPASELLGKSATEVGLSECLTGESPRVMEAGFARGGGRWELRRGSFRQEGRPHQLVVLSDLSRTLREEERQAWKRLVRVLSHEINNSLAPIKSTAGSLKSLMDRRQRPSDWEEDMSRGLEVIGARSEALIRFMQSYARLARLPPPKLASVDVGSWVRRVARLETRLPVDVTNGADLTIQADGDQLDQLLINVVGNAVDAALETGGRVRVGWQAENGQLEVWVEDDGPGIADTTNLFVPFFTTKPTGSGIGLVLSRQIAEAHGGVLTVGNRWGGRGCRALLRLPL